MNGTVRTRAGGRLLRAEVRRALHRRVVRALVAVALLLVAVTGMVALVQSDGFDPASRNVHVARFTDLWPEATKGDGVLPTVAFCLVIGALIGGASMFGGEWKAGSMTTLLTWEPRRTRLYAARFAACFGLAVVIGLVLVGSFVLALVPTYVVHGTFDGADAHWWGEFAGAVARILLVTGLAAVLGGAIAALGRNTTAALAAAFVYLAIVEAAVRGLLPEASRFLVGENAAIFLTGDQLDGTEFLRSPTAAALTLGAYTMLAASSAVVLFARRDVAG